MTTQFANASYQEIVDLHTESDTVSVIGIHTPQGDTPRKMFGGFFDQFKKFKYMGCSIKLVPAARLPADPLQVSAQYDDYQTIDPRDMLNPLMFHGCHGNDMGVILNRLYSLNSVDGPKSDSIVMEQDTTVWSLEGILAGEIPNFQLEDLYYKALTDNTWKKAHPQRGFRKSGLRPLVYKMSTNMQMLGSGQSLMGLDGLGIPGRMIEDDGQYSLPVVQSGRQFFTPGLTGLGWLDTRNVLTQAVDVDYDGSQYDSLDDAVPAIEKAIRDATLAQQTASESSLPLVYMGMILLPPAYKTEQYFRMIINHHFAFKDFRGISFSNNLAVTPAYDDFNNAEDVDPDDPDPPTPPGPDPPIGGADVLTDVIGRGNIQLVPDSIFIDTFGTFQYQDVDYTVSVNPGSTSGWANAGFAVDQDDVNQSNDSPIIGFVMQNTSDNGATIVFNNHEIPDRYNCTVLALYNGYWYVYAAQTSGGSKEWLKTTVKPAFIKFGLSVENAELLAQLGSTTAFSDITYGVS